MARGRTADDNPGERDPEGDNERLLLERRSYLRYATAAVAAVTAGSGTVTAAPASNYDRVVQVTDLGADPTGGEPIDDALRAALDDDTLVTFPEGRYRIDGVRFEGLRNVALVGEDATLVPARAGENTGFLEFFGARDLVIEGLETDVTASETAARLAVHVAGGRKNVLRDYAVTGYSDSDIGACLNVRVDPDASLLVEDLDLTDGGSGRAVNVRPAPSEDGAAGALTFKDCVVDGFGEGLAASAHSGPLHVVGGDYRNNGVAQLSVGGGGRDAPALVRDVTVVVDDPDPSRSNHRGIWFRDGEACVVRDCVVAIEDLTGTYSTGGIVQGRDAGRLEVQDTSVHVAADAAAVAAKPGDRPRAARSKEPQDSGLVLADVSVTGRASGGSAVSVTGRDGSVLDGVDIAQSGAERVGVRVVDAADVTLQSVRIDVPGAATEFVDAAVTSHDIGSDPDRTPPTWDATDETSTRETTADETSTRETTADETPTRQATGTGVSEAPLPHLLTVESDGEAAYRFSATGAVEADEPVDALVDIRGPATDSVVEGTVRDGVHGFRFDGTLTGLEVTGEAAVVRDGEAVLPVEFSDPPLSTIVEIGSSDGPVSYSFSVDGAVAPADDLALAANVYGPDVEGVTDGVHRYALSGAVTDISLTGPGGWVRVDGELVDPSAFPEPLDVTLVEVVGADDGLAGYRFSVDGLAVPADDPALAANVYGPDVEGVTDGVHRYALSGDVAHFTFTSGDGVVRVDGDPVAPSEIATRERAAAATATPAGHETRGVATEYPNRFVADGSHPGKPTHYRLAVAGDVRADPDTGQRGADDEEDGSTQSGVAEGGVRAVRFDGTVTDLRLDGDAVLDLERSD